MQPNEDVLELLQREQKIARLQMLNKGLAYDLPRRSLLKYLPWVKRKMIPNPLTGDMEKGPKVRTIVFYKQYANTMDHLAETKLQLKINLEELKKNPINYSNKAIKENNYLMVKIVAIALLNRNWKIKLFTGLLTWYLRDRIRAEDLVELCALIAELEDAGNFLNSTVLMAGTDRITMPKAEKIEEKPTKAAVNQ